MLVSREGSISLRTHEQILKWQRTRKRLTVDAKCSQCSASIRRRVWGGGECNVYCNKSCRDASYALSTKGLYRAAVAARKAAKIELKESLIYKESMALRRIAAWKPGQSPTVRPCRMCGKKAKGIGEYSRHCSTCSVAKLKESKERSRKSEAGMASRRASRAKGKAIKRAATVELFDPIFVLERDDWRCYICGIPTPREKRGTYDDDAPEVDHVIPLSKGGEHSLANVKCCCRKCNLLKLDSTTFLADRLGGPRLSVSQM